MFKDVFNELLQKNAVTVTQLSKATGISQPLISHYKQGRQTPSYDNLTKLCKYFNVSVDYMLAKKEDVGLMPTESHELHTLKKIDNVSDNLKHCLISLGKENSAHLIDSLIYFSDYIVLFRQLEDDINQQDYIDCTYEFSKSLAKCLGEVITMSATTPRKDDDLLQKKKESIRKNIEDVDKSLKNLLNIVLKDAKFDICV